jgi:hypothetical protein
MLGRHTDWVHTSTDGVIGLDYCLLADPVGWVGYLKHCRSLQLRRDRLERRRRY